MRARDENPRAPYAFIQWKGICVEYHCPCGADFTHLCDPEFAYFVRCPGCKQAYEVGWHVPLFPVRDADAPNNIIEVFE